MPKALPSSLASLGKGEGSARFVIHIKIRALIVVFFKDKAGIMSTKAE